MVHPDDIPNSKVLDSGALWKTGAYVHNTKTALGKPVKWEDISSST
jgi:hypothetical protein